jgi:hypothetical protein
MGKKQEFVHSLADFEQPAHDGRPPQLLHRTLYPSTDAVVLGRRVLQIAGPLIENSKEFAKADLSDLEQDLVTAADNFLRVRQWIELPHSEVYRGHAIAFQTAAKELLRVVREPRKEEIWDLTDRIYHKTGLPLRQERRTSAGKLLEPLGFEALLCQFISACETTVMTQGKRGCRARLDLVSAASDLADLWSKLSGTPFKKGLRPMPKQAWVDSTKPEFKSLGPRFVHLLLPAFDPNVTFTETRTALKAVPVKPK